MAAAFLVAYTVASKHDYTRNKATADRLIDKFGQALTLTKTTGGGGFDANGDPVVPSSTTITGNGVKLDFKQDEIDGTNIVAGDAKLLLGSASGAPEDGMTVPIGGLTWRVMINKPLDPAGVDVIYTLQLRQG